MSYANRSSACFVPRLPRSVMGMRSVPRHNGVATERRGPDGLECSVSKDARLHSR
jgi:hypothetical protein